MIVHVLKAGRSSVGKSEDEHRDITGATILERNFKVFLMKIGYINQKTVRLGEEPDLLREQEQDYLKPQAG